MSEEIKIDPESDSEEEVEELVKEAERRELNKKREKTKYDVRD